MIYIKDLYCKIYINPCLLFPFSFIYLLLLVWVGVVFIYFCCGGGVFIYYLLLGVGGYILDFLLLRGVVIY